ncbi:MAG TPA: hypothetical protein PKC47_07215 [Petrimonas sp.]|nr:hypothetical protein [Petrimonas sp.]
MEQYLEQKKVGVESAGELEKWMSKLKKLERYGMDTQPGIFGNV